MKELTREELLKYSKSGYLTVGALKKIIEEHNYSDDAIIVVERVEDSYFEGGIDISGYGGYMGEDGKGSIDGIYPPGSRTSEWGVYLKGGDSYYHSKEHNKNIDSGKYLDKDKYPDIKPENLKKYSEEEIHLMQTQYRPVWGPAVYYDEKEILFLNLHY